MKSTITIITDVMIPEMAVAAFEEVESNKASKWGTRTRRKPIPVPVENHTHNQVQVFSGCGYGFSRILHVHTLHNYSILIVGKEVCLAE